MSIRKILGYGFIFSLATCDTIVSKGITCQHSNDSLSKLFVGETATTLQPPNRNNVPIAVKPQTQPNESIVIASSIEAKFNQKPRENIQKPSPSLINHLHPQANASGTKSTKKTLWQEDNRSQQTSQSYDKNGRVHQIHKWKDTKGRRHQTDQWTDKDENVHQCHIFEDEDGCIHEAIQVTSPAGIVINEHFNKDKEGKITKVQAEKKAD